MVPVLKLDPFSNQWDQIDVLTLNVRILRTQYLVIVRIL